MTTTHRSKDSSGHRQVGIITMAYGSQKYVDQAITLARSLRRHMPGFKIAIVTDRENAGPLFDYTVNIESFSIAGTLLKVRMYDASPFEETFFIDSDCVVVRNFEEQLAEIRRYDFSPIVNTYLVDGDEDLWLEDVGRALERVGGRRFPKFNGGVYFFRKSQLAQRVFRRASEILDDKDQIGILDFDEAGPGEETLIGLALAEMHLEDFYDDEGKLMKTPLNSEGAIELEVLEGKSGFIKNGRKVTPAIVHFCGPWIRHPVYEIARDELVRERRLNAMTRTGIHFRYQLEQLKSRVRRKAAGL